VWVVFVHIFFPTPYPSVRFPQIIWSPKNSCVIAWFKLPYLPQSHAVQTSSNVRQLTTFEIRKWCLIQFSACTIWAVYIFFLWIKLNCLQLRQSEYISKCGLRDFSIALYKYILLYYYGLYFLILHIHKIHHEKAAMHLILPRAGRIFVWKSDILSAGKEIYLFMEPQDVWPCSQNSLVDPFRSQYTNCTKSVYRDSSFLMFGVSLCWGIS